MAWVKLDDAMPYHPKVMAAGPQAFALDVAGICYSNKHATDGFIADASLPAVYPALTTPKRHAEKLVQVGRWVRVDGGWQIHDVGDYQPSAAEQKEISKKRAEAGKRGGKASGQARAKPKQIASTSEANGKQVASTEPNPDPTRPYTSPNGEVTASLFEAFYEFWIGKPYSTGVPLNELERGRINKAVKVAKQAGYTPGEVQRRSRLYRKRWSDLDRTPQALLANWSRFEPETEIVVCSTCSNRGRVGFTESGEPTGMDAPEAVDYGLCPMCHPEVAL